jgi:SAM-dependent methyltransferase
LVVGADPGLDDLKAAHARLRFHESVGRPGNWSLTGADITHLPFADHSFDTVICAEVLEHIPDHGRAIRETVRVLKPGGNLVVSVPRAWPEAICWALSPRYRRTEGGHLRIYSRKRLVRRIRSCGVVHEHTHYAHSLHSPYWWLRCLLGPDRDDPWPVRQYHRLLTWDMMQRPPVTRATERLLDPLLGKSVVLYFRKPVQAGPDRPCNR